MTDALPQGANRPEDDPVDRVRTLLQQRTGSRALAEILSFEFATIFYSLLSWRRGPAISAAATSFTTHKHSNWPFVAVGLGIAVLAESIGIHLWIAPQAPGAAIVIALLELYGLLWLIADARALSLRPILLYADRIELRFGFRWRATIPMIEIESAAWWQGEKKGPATLQLSAVDDPNVILRMRSPIRVNGPYGFSRLVRAIHLVLDDREGFATAMKTAGVWVDPIVPSPEPKEPIVENPLGTMSYEEWLASRPDYIPLEEWLTHIPPWVKK